MPKKPEEVKPQGPAVLPRSQRKDGKVEVYGSLWEPGTLWIAVELREYRVAGTERASPGNRGAEYHFRRAFAMMWPNYEMSDWVDLLIHGWCNYKWVTVIGHQRASKSYTIAHCLYLDYCADPNNTLTTMGTVTFEGLKIRMWSDLQRAHETAAIPHITGAFTMRSTTNEMRVYATENQGESAQKFQIMGMAMNNSADAEGRVRGGHAPRRRIILDEAEDIADPIYEAMINPMSAPDAKAVMLCNPMERESLFGKNCEPRDGWSSVDPSSLIWETKAKGGICIHLDGLQSPNVKAKINKFTGLLTFEGVEEVRSKHGEDSRQWWQLVRGWFPPDGIVSRVFPGSTIEKAKAVITFDYKPERCASLDPAFEHDQCVLHLGDLGYRHRGDLQQCINGTQSIEIKFKVGPDQEPKDYQIVHQVMALCKENDVKPEHFIMDRSGGGRGVFAILQKEWSQDIHGVEYGGKATERNLRGDDDRKCEDIYKYFVSELWFRASEFAKEGLIGGLKNLHPHTIEDLISRRYEIKQETSGSKQVVETKVEVKKRLGRSPDHGDAFVQFGELLERLGTRPGGNGKKPSTQSQRWNRFREKAAQLASIYSPDSEFAHADI